MFPDPPPPIPCSPPRPPPLGPTRHPLTYLFARPNSGPRRYPPTPLGPPEREKDKRASSGAPGRIGGRTAVDRARFNGVPPRASETTWWANNAGPEGDLGMV
eukprot:9499261-Pyramimonas_sp.AAC.3